MPQYLVKKPCAYTNADGNGVTWTQEAADAGVSVVELPAETAEALGDAVQALAVPDASADAPSVWLPDDTATEEPAGG